MGVFAARRMGSSRRRLAPMAHQLRLQRRNDPGAPRSRYSSVSPRASTTARAVRRMLSGFGAASGHRQKSGTCGSDRHSASAAFSTGSNTMPPILTFTRTLGHHVHEAFGTECRVVVSDDQIRSAAAPGVLRTPRIGTGAGCRVRHCGPPVQPPPWPTARAPTPSDRRGWIGLRGLMRGTAARCWARGRWSSLAAMTGVSRSQRTGRSSRSTGSVQDIGTPGVLPRSSCTHCGRAVVRRAIADRNGRHPSRACCGSRGWSSCAYRRTTRSGSGAADATSSAPGRTVASDECASASMSSGRTR